jgi:hypothetical protein
VPPDPIRLTSNAAPGFRTASATRALHDADPFSSEPADVHDFLRHINERRRRGYDHLQAVRSWRPDLPT